jgi:hypothetical protein
LSGPAGRVIVYIPSFPERDAPMAQLLCEVGPGLRAAEATVKVRDYEGRPEFLPTDRHLLARVNGHHFLPVRVIIHDEGRRAALVELPVEADSGAHRIWVRSSDLNG